MEDMELVERARDGDIGAYGELVRRYQGAAIRTAYVLTKDKAEAEDVAQEAFVKAHGALHRFRSGAPFRPWLLQIVANEAKNHRRSTDRRASLALRAAKETSLGGAAPSPEEAALAEDERRTLLGALNALSEEDRLVIAHRYFLDLSEAETAEALGCARGTVKSRLSRAIGRLRDRMPVTSSDLGEQGGAADG